MDDFKELKAVAKSKNISVYVVTPAPDEVAKVLNENNLNEVPVFSCDNTAVRTAARTNPALYLLQKGTILNKYSYRQLDEAVAQLKNM